MSYMCAPAGASMTCTHWKGEKGRERRERRRGASGLFLLDTGVGLRESAVLHQRRVEQFFHKRFLTLRGLEVHDLGEVIRRKMVLNDNVSPQYGKPCSGPNGCGSLEPRLWFPVIAAALPSHDFRRHGHVAVDPASIFLGPRACDALEIHSGA